jgi:hypothetical protein
MTIVTKLWRIPKQEISEVNEIGENNLTHRPNVTNIEGIIYQYEIKNEVTIDTVEYYETELVYDDSNESIISTEAGYTLLST